MIDTAVAMRRRSRPNLPVAIVIGGCGGMGLACVRRLAQQHAVVIADRDTARLGDVVAQLSAEGFTIVGQPCDATARGNVEALFAKARELGEIIAVAHVLGLSPSMADGRTVMSVNLIAPALVAEVALEHLRSGGAAVFVSSIAGHRVSIDADVIAILDDPLAAGFIDAITMAVPDFSSHEAYRHSKSALLRLCRRYAGRWGERGLRIVSLSPGLIRTPMGDREFERGPGKDRLLSATPLQRQGELTEVADALEFLLSERASFISGTDLLIDGGLLSHLEFEDIV